MKEFFSDNFIIVKYKIARWYMRMKNGYKMMDSEWIYMSMLSYKQAMRIAI
jgi:hypothetical protein